MGERLLDDGQIARLETHRRRWRRVKVSAVVGVGLLLLAVVLADRLGAFGFAGDDVAAFDGGRFVVADVIDGDTLKVRDRGGLVSVRLIGIDAPERGRPWADQATAELAGLEGETVQLALDPVETRDRYGRLLAYVYDGGAGDALVNRRLVAEGHAYAERRFPHPYQRNFAQVERQARGKSLGLWADHDEARQPEWRRAWLVERR